MWANADEMQKHADSFDLSSTPCLSVEADFRTPRPLRFAHHDRQRRSHPYPEGDEAYERLLKADVKYPFSLATSECILLSRIQV